MVALVTVFFVPELVELIGPSMLFNSKFVRKVFWDAVNSREKNGEKRGDFIDSLIQLKNGEQNPDYSEYLAHINIISILVTIFLGFNFYSYYDIIINIHSNKYKHALYQNQRIAIFHSQTNRIYLRFYQ